MAYFKAKIWIPDIPTTKQECYPLYCRYPLGHSSICSLELNVWPWTTDARNYRHTGMCLLRMTVMSGLSVRSHRGQNFRHVNTKSRLIWVTQLLQIMQPAQRCVFGLAAPTICDQYKPISALRDGIQPADQTLYVSRLYQFSNDVEANLQFFYT